MSESSVHMHYVNQLLLFAKKLIPEDKHSFIFVDQPDSFQKPPRTNLNFIPDLYYRLNDFLVIGEAKTYGVVIVFFRSADYCAVDVLDDSFAAQGGAFPADKATFFIIVTGTALTVGFCGIGHIGLLTRVFCSDYWGHEDKTNSDKGQEGAFQCVSNYK